MENRTEGAAFVLKMINRIAIGSRYLRYYIRGKGRHGIHSPFVYDFIEKVIRDHDHYPEYTRLKKFRRNLFHNRNVIETVDFGSNAGNKDFVTYRERVQNLAKKRSHSVKYTHFLFRVVRYFKPASILEFGTATGMSAAALSMGNPGAKVLSLEGCASISQVASSAFDKFDLKNIDIVIGNFKATLSKVLEENPVFDMVFFDGNHRKVPTVDYFNHCLVHKSSDSVFIFDDIHWSSEMEEAWEIIKAHPEVTLTIDLFQFGMVFFKEGIAKQHFILRM